MKISEITRRLVKDIVNVHVQMLLAECRRLDKAAEVASQNVEDQRTVVTWANQELQRRRKTLDQAYDTASEAWRRASQEIDSLPRF